MTNHTNEANDYNAKIIEEFRANGGRLGKFHSRITRQIPVLMLTCQH
jgi:hypothetical protein